MAMKKYFKKVTADFQVTAQDRTDAKEVLELEHVPNQSAADRAALTETLTNKTITNPLGIVSDDIVDSASANKFVTAADVTKLGNISVTQAVDLDAMETDIAALANGMVYKGNWDASAGTFPGGGTAQTGAFYYASVAGTVDSVAFAIGDNVVATTDNASTTTFSGNWSKHDQTDAVQSVAGRTGSVTLAVADITDAGALASLGTVGSSEVDDEAITYAKMQHVSATDKLLGRSTAGAGDVEEVACTAAGRALLDDADASAQRDTLGLQIGSDVQAHSALLDNTTASYTTAEAAKVAHITVTQAVNLDTMESNIALKAPLASPTFTGAVIVPVAATDTEAAQKVYVDTQTVSKAVTTLTDVSAPHTLAWGNTYELDSSSATFEIDFPAATGSNQRLMLIGKDMTNAVTHDGGAATIKGGDIDITDETGVYQDTATNEIRRVK